MSKRPGSAPPGDRFIPSRSASGDLHSAYELLRSPLHHSNSANGAATHDRGPYSVQLRDQLLDARTVAVCAAPVDARNAPGAQAQTPAALSALKRVAPHQVLGARAARPRPVSGSNIFRFQPDPPVRPLTAPPCAYPNRPSLTRSVAQTPLSPPHGTLSAHKALLGVNGARAMRKVAGTPFKVLDAPSLKDDFYLNLVDWSSTNVLGVGLGNCVYLWSAHTSVVTKLCELKFGGPVCSVSWSQSGAELAVGTAAGLVQVWDTAACKLVRTMPGHRQRVGCLAWGSSLLSSGGKDFDICNRDMRARQPVVTRLSGHRQEVCGLRWSPDDTQLASGGNDNKLLIWSAAGLGCSASNADVAATSRRARDGFAVPMLTFSEHEAAIKAIAWSPHARGLLASGGGTQDKTIRFWNTLSGNSLACVDTGSQVCNLAWSRNVNEIVSTHGYSQNQIVVWKYPSLTKVATLTGHSMRVLYLAVSPSGETIVTGAGDQTLRFWNVFPGARGKSGDHSQLSLLSPSRMHIR